MRPLVHSLALATVLAGVGAAWALAGELPAARESALSYMVRQDCGSCHGMTLRGGLGRSLSPEALQEADVESVAQIILDGLPGTPMPPWRGLLSGTEARWIARALKEGRIQEKGSLQ